MKQASFRHCSKGEQHPSRSHEKRGEKQFVRHKCRHARGMAKSQLHHISFTDLHSGLLQSTIADNKLLSECSKAVTKNSCHVSAVMAFESSLEMLQHRRQGRASMVDPQIVTSPSCHGHAATVTGQLP